MKVSVIIVNWNTRELLKKCLQSLERYRNNHDYEIIVVDNDSKDGSADMVQKEFPWMQLVANSYNAMFAQGNNIGYKRSTGKYIFLLNPDTELQNDGIGILARYLDEHPRVGAAAGKFLNPDGSFQRYYNRWPTIPAILLYNSPLPLQWLKKIPSTRKYMMLDVEFTKPTMVPQPAAAGIMVKREAIKDDPWLLDPIFPLLFNDVDLCKRIYDRDYSIYYIPEALILHHHGGGGLNLLQRKKKKEHKYTTTYIGGYVHYLNKHASTFHALIFKISALFLLIIDIAISGILHISKEDWLKEVLGKGRRIIEFIHWPLAPKKPSYGKTN